MGLAKSSQGLLYHSEYNMCLGMYVCVWYSTRQVLSDEEKRKIYDKHGEEGLKQHLARESSGGGGGHPFGNIFSQFFGFGGCEEYL